MIGRNDLCWCGSGQKWKKCHFPVAHASTGSKTHTREHYLQQYGILIKTEEEIAGIRRAGHVAAAILDTLCKAAKKGTTTEELDILSRQLHTEQGATPAPLGYGNPPFPKSICTSLNEVICHGIPDARPLEEGDILNIDVTSIVDGYYGDCSKMVVIGAVSEERQRVVDASFACLMESIQVVKPGALVSDIGAVIQAVAESYSCSVVTQYVGHGVGVRFHEPPHIPHYKNSVDIPLVAGMTFTIEPMINAGVPDAVVDKSDHWTAKTRDQRASAQWEHTILVTPDGHEILTPWMR